MVHHGKRHISKQFSASNTSSNCTLSVTLWALMVAVCLVSLVPSTDGCYLRNCPLGKREGKRQNGAAEEESPVINSCPACGVNGIGQCLGPFTCCSPDSGCIMGVGIPETAPCSKETSNPIPCTAEGKKCGYNSEGVCASRGVCCSEERCEFTMECGPNPGNRIDIRQLIRGY